MTRCGDIENKLKRRYVGYNNQLLTFPFAFSFFPKNDINELFHFRSDITVVCKAMEFGQFPLGMFRIYKTEIVHSLTWPQIESGCCRINAFNISPTNSFVLHKPVHIDTVVAVLACTGPVRSPDQDQHQSFVNQN